MTDTSALSSLWVQDSEYWIVIEGAGAATLGFNPVHHRSDLVAMQTSARWWEQWKACVQQMGDQAATYKVAIIPARELPSVQEITLALKSVAEMDAIAAHVWLVQDVHAGSLDCYMQRVMDRRGKQVGYEAFARIGREDGVVVGGGAIMQAAHALRLEYQLDRLLHKQAIESFVGSDLGGYIFINFLTGFIHRPEIYFEGLSQAVTHMHVHPGSVVLDVPLGEYSADIAKLKSIAHFCQMRGFSLALDDVRHSDGLLALLADVRPAFVKLDRTLGEHMSPMRAQDMVREIVRICHAHGVSVLAEGVETEQEHALYMAAEVDMFQGYFFGAPERMARIVAA